MTNVSRVSMSITTQLIPELDGDFTLQPDQQLRLRQRTGSSTTIGSPIKVGILGDLQPGLNGKFFLRRKVLWQNWTCTTSTSRRATSIICFRRNKVSKHMWKGSCLYRNTCCQDEFDSHSFFFLVQVIVVRLPETFTSLAIDGERCKRKHLSHATFEHAQSFHSLFAQLARISQSQS